MFTVCRLTFHAVSASLAGRQPATCDDSRVLMSHDEEPVNSYFGITNNENHQLGDCGS